MEQKTNALMKMLAAWNERDLSQIRTHIDQSIAENGVFADPTNFIHGRDAFEEMIKEFRLENPEAVLKPTSGVDSHNNRYRYSWGNYVGETLTVKGFDVVTLNENGLVERVDGFFGDLPPLKN